MVCGAENLNEDDYVRLKRGLDPAKADSVLKAKSFVCDGGAVVLDMSAVNDDYCDCEDGTDEYGTAACNNGVFTCSSPDENGEVQRVFSALVNDEICDCCDCSDEWMLPMLKRLCIRKVQNKTQTEGEQYAVPLANDPGRIVEDKGNEAYMFHAWTCVVLSAVLSTVSSYYIVKYAAQRRRRPHLRSFTPRLALFV